MRFLACSFLLGIAVVASGQPKGLTKTTAWAVKTERTVGGPEADLVVRTGDINNLGFGWPQGFDPFSGKSTPAHGYPWTPPAGAPEGTDRIMLGSAVTEKDVQTRSGDGYASSTKRPGNLPAPVTLAGARCLPPSTPWSFRCSWTTFSRPCSTRTSRST